MTEAVSETPALQATEAAKKFPYGPWAVAGVSLAVGRGEVVALVGESGSGKTTLLRMFNRMVHLTKGKVRVKGRPVGKWDPIVLRRSVGYVEQEGGLLPHWTIGRNVGLVPSLLGWKQKRIRARVNELLAMVDLEPGRYRRRYPLQLSGGQRQRVAFARALAADPEIVLLDEPFGALDAITRVQLHEQFMAMQDQLQKTMLLVTHDLAEAFRLADRIGVMRQGRLLQVGAPEELVHQPADSYVAKLLRHRGEVMV